MDKVKITDYLCPSCGQVILRGEKKCPSCRKVIRWSDVKTSEYWVWPDGLKNHPEDPEYKDFFPGGQG